VEETIKTELFFLSARRFIPAINRGTVFSSRQPSTKFFRFLALGPSLAGFRKLEKLILFLVRKERYRQMFHVKHFPEKHVSQENRSVKHFCETFMYNFQTRAPGKPDSCETFCQVL